MSKPPVSVCLIVKNARRSLKRTLTSLHSFLREGDEVVVVDTGSTDKTATLARRAGCRVIERPDLCDATQLDRAREWCPLEAQKYLTDPQFAGGWVGSFAEARTVSFAAAKNDLCLWLDADDTLHGGQALREGIDKFFGGDNPVAALFLRYDYSHDSEDGRCTTVLWRERVVDRREFDWKGRCHEVLIPKGGIEAIQSRVVRCTVPEIFVQHEPKFKKSAGVSDIRNYVILRRELEESGPKPDPRTIYYMGNAARGLRRWQEAVHYYRWMLECSGSPDDRFSAALNSGHCAAAQQRWWQLLQWGSRAIDIKPGDPRGYFMRARAYYHLGKWSECLLWTDFGRRLRPDTETLHSADPNSWSFYPTYYAMEAHKELGDVDKTLREAQRLLDERPELGVARRHVDSIRQWADQRRVAEAVITAARAAPDRDSAAALTQLIAEPGILEEFGIGRLETSVHSDGRAVLAIVCGRTHEEWGPRSIETGIGGSERMVIELAPRLAAKGLAVTVYAHVPQNQRGPGPSGVQWRHYTEFNPKLKRDYILSWRSPESLDLPVAARRRYVWLHDTVDARRFTPARTALASKVIVMSEWQRRLYPDLPDSKVWVSRNGIDAAQFKGKVERNPKRVIYSSSPDRGLVQALNAFVLARQVDPELTLDIYYGFTPYYYRMAAKTEYGYVVTCDKTRHLHEFTEEVYQAVENTPGCRLVGRVPCAQVAEEMLASGIWLYPTPFTEISCISAMEAQAAGLCVVASKVAALAETIDWTSPLAWEAPPSVEPSINAEKILEASRVAADDSRRTAQSVAAQKRFDLGALADEWNRTLFV